MKLAIQRGPVDPQYPRRFRLVPAGSLQDALDILSLQLLERILPR